MENWGDEIFFLDNKFFLSCRLYNVVWWLCEFCFLWQKFIIVFCGIVIFVGISFIVKKSKVDFCKNGSVKFILQNLMYLLYDLCCYFICKNGENV